MVIEGMKIDPHILQSLIDPLCNDLAKELCLESLICSVDFSLRLIRYILLIRMFLRKDDLIKVTSQSG